MKLLNKRPPYVGLQVVMVMVVVKVAWRSGWACDQDGGSERGAAKRALPYGHDDRGHPRINKAAVGDHFRWIRIIDKLKQASSTKLSS